MIATAEWIEKWQSKKSLLQPVSDLNGYFTLKEIAGKRIESVNLGQASFPTGQVLVRDPLCYFRRSELPFMQSIPPGNYPVTACVILPDDGDCARYAAVKLTVSDKAALRFEEALVGNENLESCQRGDYFGFNVDAGLATIADVATRDAYIRFFNRWYQDNPDLNNYDGYFAALFAESYRKNPQHQRSGGDWINWTVPGTDLQMPIFQSGFGDGCYPVYMGYDDNDDVCCIIIEFIDISLAYSDSEAED
jgi:hypothetical protein